MWYYYIITKLSPVRHFLNNFLDIILQFIYIVLGMLLLA